MRTVFCFLFFYECQGMIWDKFLDRWFAMYLDLFDKTMIWSNYRGNKCHFMTWISVFQYMKKKWFCCVDHLRSAWDLISKFCVQGLNDLATETANSPGPFRNILMSKAAQTHKLRKLRAPSKCRECDSLVVFHGAECEEVGMSWILVWLSCKVLRETDEAVRGELV